MVTDSWHLIQDAKYLKQSRETEEAASAYNVFMQVLNEFETARYHAWIAALQALDSSNLQARLENPLMRRASAEDAAHATSLAPRARTRTSSATSTRACSRSSPRCTTGRS